MDLGPWLRFAISRRLLFLLVCFKSWGTCYQQQQQQKLHQQQHLAISRRRSLWLAVSVLAPSIITTTTTPSSGLCWAASSTTMVMDPRDTLQNAQEALSSLLDHWERATVDCTYADVPRELLEQRNKQQLLEKASTWALFDKSDSLVVSCKTSNRIVREYLGATGKGPLVGIDKTIRQSLEYLADPDQLDDYLNVSEQFLQAISRASSLSYAAGVADLDSVNNFAQDRDDDDGIGESTNRIKTNRSTNLEQARQAIADAKQSLDQLLVLLVR